MLNINIEQNTPRDITPKATVICPHCDAVGTHVLSSSQYDDCKTICDICDQQFCILVRDGEVCEVR